MAKNPFNIFTLANQTVFIEALDSEVTFRALTMAESDAFNKRLLGDNYSVNGDANIDINEVTKVNYEKIELCLVEPKMTVAELKNLPVTATKAIAEIIKAIDGRVDEDDEEVNEGN